MTDKKKKLTPKQQLFVSEYLKTGNATEAARRAGYKGSDNTLKSIGQENLTKPDVAEAINAKNQKRSDRLELEEDFELKMANKILDMAIEDHDLKNAISAVQTMAKIRGKYVQKLQVGVADDIASMLARIKTK